jgi:hypothetical protein
MGDPKYIIPKCAKYIRKPDPQKLSTFQMPRIPQCMCIGKCSGGGRDVSFPMGSKTGQPLVPQHSLDENTIILPTLITAYTVPEQTSLPSSHWR